MKWCFICKCCAYKNIDGKVIKIDKIVYIFLGFFYTFLCEILSNSFNLGRKVKSLKSVWGCFNFTADLINCNMYMYLPYNPFFLEFLLNASDFYNGVNGANWNVSE